MSDSDRSQQINLIIATILEDAESGTPLPRETLLARHPEFGNELREFFQEHDRLNGVADPASDAKSKTTGQRWSEDTVESPLPMPARLGRYHVLHLLGEGGFGQVYLARDEDLQRGVAIKLATQVVGDAHIGAFLAEARTVATLDHPHIVPVYDVGRTDDGRVYVVSKRIDGCDLANRVKEGPLSYAKAASLVATLADALHYAHEQGLVHRDIKPGNILVDRRDQAHLCDFGLALRAEQYGQGPAYAGTPAYMSPEQARGEGHRVDRRSDIYSLGVVLYELLTNRRLFDGDVSTPLELLQRVAVEEPRPPRHLVENIPPKLERITLRCVAKRASDRYPTAASLAEDLRDFLTGDIEVKAHDVKVVPRGLRSFDREDSEFFLQLLPGARDRNGLPDSIGFWKVRLEQRDSSRTFGIGLLYGPSGSGKSSLIKAGLLPRLTDQVHVVYVEATADETELHLLALVRKEFPEVADSRSLKDALSRLRLGQLALGSRKLVLFIDHFEQWLHARHQYAGRAMAEILGQCDGGNVQAVLMVRDDFWMDISEFLYCLDVPILEGVNAYRVSLFDLLHARKVLAEFGRAYGRLPDNLGQMSDEQERFLDEAVGGLAIEGKVVPVSLALFSEMVKGRPWTRDTLKRLGGISGIGTAFLEDTFVAATAPPEHRFHQAAARAVLKTLLPAGGTNIKGHNCSRSQLQESSGYNNRPRDFQTLLQILDNELRLITQTEIQEAAEAQRETDAPSHLKERDAYYQLTHDYLVPALREWLNRRRRETLRGRAELRLEECADLWSARRETRYLPSAGEFVHIATLTDRRTRTSAQRAMMQSAGRIYARRAAMISAVLVVLAIGGIFLRSRMVERERRHQASSLAQQILTAEIDQVPSLIDQLDELRLRPLAEPSLRNTLRQPDDDAEHLRASLALARDDPQQVEFLLRRVPSLLPQEVRVVRETLAQNSPAATVVDRLWKQLAKPSPDEPTFLPIAATLALLSPEDDRWKEYGDSLAEALVRANVVHLGDWLNLLEDVRLATLPGLAAVYADRSEQRDALQRNQVTMILKRYAFDQPELLAELLIVGQAEQFEPIFELASKPENAQPVANVLHKELERQIEPDWRDPAPSDQWSEPDDNLRAAIIEAQGTIDPERRFAFVQAMPLEQFQKAVEQLRPSGFRPIRVRPYRSAGRLNVAAVWRRDGQLWKLTWEHSQAEFDVQNETKLDGMVPVDVSGYLADEGGRLVERYVVLWSAYVDSEQADRIVAGVLDQEFASCWKTRSSLGPVSIESLHVFVGLEGTRKYSAVFTDRKTRPSFVTSYGGWSRAGEPMWDVAIASGGRAADVRAEVRRNLEATQERLKYNPASPRQRLRRAQCHVFLGDDQAALDDLNELLDDMDYRSSAQQLRAYVLARQGRREESLDALDDFLTTAADPTATLASVVTNAWLGEHKRALEQLERLASLPPGDWTTSYNAACAAAIAARPTGRGEPDAEANYRTRALQLLKAAVEAGFRDHSHLRTDSDLVALHDDSSFQQLLDDLAVDYQYAGLWHANTQFESRLLSELTVAEHLQQSRELARQRYRPVSWSVMASAVGKSEPAAASVWHRPLVPDQQKEELAVRQAQAAAALVRLQHVDSVWPLLRQRPDPRLRSFLVDRLGSLGVDAEQLFTRLMTEVDSSARRAILLILGDLAHREAVDELLHERLVKELLALYRDDPDPGIHGAAEWVLRQLGESDKLAETRGELANGQVVGDRLWYVTRASHQTMIVLQPSQPFLMGSPVTDTSRLGGPAGRNEVQHWREVPRSFAIASTEVPVSLYREFAHETGDDLPSDWPASQPVTTVSWYRAAEFCNWFSRKEGIPRQQWCYDPDEPFVDGMKLYPDYLERTGYRLPTEAEWEFACRSGTTTARYFGETDTLAPQYAWYLVNSNYKSLLPVGTLKPNDFGLFDTLGNVLEWTQDAAASYPTRFRVVLDEEQHKMYGAEQLLTVQTTMRRILRGGSFSSVPPSIRAASREPLSPSYLGNNFGLRVARTLATQ